METMQQETLIQLGITELNPMQTAAQKAILKQNDILLLAPTGSGKTVAFLLPLLRLLNPAISGVQCLVLVPSRELALQIESVWKKMSTGFKVNVCYGGHNAQTEARNLSTPPALLIGTPGRIADHINKGRITMNTIQYLVLDEFDKSLEMGFQNEMEFIFRELKNLQKKILVSATSAISIPDFAQIKSPSVLDYIPKNTTKSDELTLKLVISEERDKLQALYQLLCNINSESAIVFCNHRDACERAVGYLNSKGIVSAFYHGGMEQNDRELALIRFRNGSVNYLVTTDLAARGLDIPEMKHVVHYQLPLHETEFTHRNGRTARMMATGTAYLLLSQNESQPDYVSDYVPEFRLNKLCKLPSLPFFQTLYINGGKKNKLNKIDIVGCFMQKGQLAKEDMGLIEVQDFNSFVAVKTKTVAGLLQKIQDEKIKGKKWKIGVAR